jgi:hypothetical protein
VIRRAILVSVLALVAWSPVSPDDHVTADRPVLDRVFQEAHLSERVPTPHVGDWLAWRTSRIVHRVREWIGDQAAAGSALVSIVLTVGLILVVVAIVAGVIGLVALASSAVRGRRRDRAHDAVDPDLRAPIAEVRGPRWWSDALDRALEGGDPRAALEALWWWLAGTLSGSEVASSWTCRDLLRNATRTDLRVPLRRLERLTYHPAEGSLADVAGLASELRTLVSGGMP